MLDGKPPASDVEQVRAVSLYLLWANKSKRDEIMRPRREIDRLVVLLTQLGVPAQRIVRYALPREGFRTRGTARPDLPLFHGSTCTRTLITASNELE